MDHQVKIRGFRIELGEVEAVLRTHPAIRQAVVTAQKAGPSDTRLVAYVIYEVGSELTVSDLRRFLRQKLPEYMVPSIAVAISRLPLMPNGKLDRKALPAPFAASSRPADASDPPAPGIEAMIAEIWQGLLKIEAIGAEDNFFDLGGHSLLALRAVAQIEKRTGARLDPRLLFFQSLRQIAFSLAKAKVSA
jgi:acyl carrier protein